LGPTIAGQGHNVKLIAPQFVKPYVKSNKNDVNDADAICESMSRPSMRFVAVKTVEQQDIQAVRFNKLMTHIGLKCCGSNFSLALNSDV
jgi:transposase